MKTIPKAEFKELRTPLNDLVFRKMKELKIETLKDLAERSGIGRQTLYDALRGRAPSHKNWGKPGLDTLIKLAAALKVPTHELLYIVEPDAPGAELMRARRPAESLLGVRMVELRVAGWCGAGPDQFDELLDEHVCVEEDFVRGRDLVAFRIRGDSMEAGKNPIYNGDTVLVDRSDKGYDTASVVARLTSGGYVCKTLKDDKFGVNLISANPNYTNGTPPYIPSSDIAELIGRVVRIIHDQETTS